MTTPYSSSWKHERVQFDVLQNKKIALSKSFIFIVRRNVMAMIIKIKIINTQHLRT